MRVDDCQIFEDYLEPPLDLNVWEWAAQHVDYSLAPEYDSESNARYDPEFIPLWKEVTLGS